MKTGFLAASLIGSILSATVAFEQAHAANFEGKTVRVIINFPSGGPTDILMRQLAPAISTHLPGKPAMVIENRPGAGGLIGSNYVYANAAPDGLTLGFLTGLTLPALINMPQVKYDLDGFRWVSAIPQTQVLVGRKELGIGTPVDFLKPKMTIVHGSSGAGEAGTVLTTLFYKMAKIDVKYVVGYRGQADSDLALVRGEINTADMGLTTFISQQTKISQEGVVAGIVQRGVYQPDGTFRRHRLLPDLMTQVEALEELNPSAKSSVDFGAFALTAGTFGVHFGFLLPPKTNEDIVAAYRSAVFSALNNAETRKTVQERLNLEYDLLSGEEAEKMVSGIRKELAGKPDVKQLLQKMISE